MASRTRAQADPHAHFGLRLHVAMLFFVCLLGLVVYRLTRVQIVQRKPLRAEYEKQIYRMVKIGPNRGDILDRRGEPLATSAFFDTIFLDRRCFGDQEWEITKRVAEAMGLSRLDLVNRLKDNRIPIARKIDPALSDAIIANVSQIPGRLPYGAVTVDSESKRLYPKGSLASTLLGFCEGGIHENKGLEGLEAQFNPILEGKIQEQKLMVNHWGRSIQPIDEQTLLETHGDSIQLTLDYRIQHFAEAALARRIEELEARSGACVVMDPRDGAILAMASYPTYLPDDPSTRKPDAMRNRPLVDILEPGSVMKIFTYAAALDHQKAALGEIIDCEQGQYTFVSDRRQTRSIKDFHPMGVETLEEAFFESSNIAAVKIGLRMDANYFQNKLNQLGFGAASGLDFPGESAGRMPTGAAWTFYTHTSVPFGYEIGVNAVQMASGIATIANGGARMRPRLVERHVSPRGKTVKEFKPEVLARGVFQPLTCQIMTTLMEGAVREGTGSAAAVPGYRVAGKTGTTIRYDTTAGGYSEGAEYIASFGGFLPASDPRLVIYCWIDGVKRGGDAAYTGGRVTGPVFKEIASEAVRLLGIPPDMDMGQPRIAAGSGAGTSEAKLPVPRIDAGLPRKLTREMPDLEGMTMREVRETLLTIRDLNPQQDLQPRFYGSGVVIWQNPPAGAPLESLQECEIHFGRPFGELSPPQVVSQAVPQS